MTTKIQLQDTIETYKRSSEKYHELYLQEKARADQLQVALDQQFPDLEHAPENAYPATQNAIYYRNQPKRDAVAKQFKRIVEWASWNMGYHGYDAEEKAATALGQLVYMAADVEPSFAIRFAAEVCEQWNYHGECARLMGLHDQITNPYQNWPQQSQTVNWWVD